MVDDESERGSNQFCAWEIAVLDAVRERREFNVVDFLRESSSWAIHWGISSKERWPSEATGRQWEIHKQPLSV